MYHVLERTKTSHANFKKKLDGKNASIIKLPWWISFNINAITIGAVEWRRLRSLWYIAHKIHIYFYNLDKIIDQEATRDNLQKAFIKTGNNKCRVILDVQRFLSKD